MNKMNSNYQHQHTQATKLHAHKQFHLNRCIQDNIGCVVFKYSVAKIEAAVCNYYN